MKKTVILILSISLLVSLSSCALLDENATEDPDATRSETALTTKSDAAADDPETIDDPVVTESESVAQTDPESSFDFEDFSWLTFTNEEHGFTIDYPDNWNVHDPSGSYAAFFRPYQGTQTTFYVDFYQSSFVDYTYDMYIEDMISRLQRIHPDYEYGERESVEIGDQPFVALSYIGPGLDGNRFFYRNYYTARGYGFIVKYVLQEDELEAAESIAETMAHSFRFLP